jgi:hypothetical protein
MDTDKENEGLHESTNDADQDKEKIDREALKKLKAGMSKAAEAGDKSKVFRPDPYD